MFSVVFIVKNEERSLGAAIKSLGTVSEIIVCDTGSTDGTVRVARDLGARVCEFAWCDDFSAARGFAAAQASNDWIVRFDADERLAMDDHSPTATWLHDTILRADTHGAAMVCVRREHQPGFVHWFPRCYRRSMWTWRYPVHELLVSRCGSRLPVVAGEGATVSHARDSRPRHYRSILEQALSATPRDPYLAYFMGRTCVDDGDAPSAVLALHAYLTTEGGYKWHRSEAHFLIGKLFALRGDCTRAIESFERASSVAGPRAEPLLDACRVALFVGRNDIAHNFLARGRQIPLPMERQMFGSLDVPYLIDRRAYEPRAWDTIEQALAHE